jgi:hypothetical protein
MSKTEIDVLCHEYYLLRQMYPSEQSNAQKARENALISEIRLFASYDTQQVIAGRAHAELLKRSEP